jgi:hypothetical protein
MLSPIKGEDENKILRSRERGSCEEFLKERRIDFGNSSIGN